MNFFSKQRLVFSLCLCGLICSSSPVMASAFQIFEQDGASIGNYHAGYAAEANDASTAFYNPAGIMRIKNQQAVFGADIVTTDFKYQGNVGITESVETRTYHSVTAQGGTFNLIPFLHYVAPISDYIGFGFSVTIPFGLKTDYGKSTPLRYAATLSSITVVNISPALAFKVTDKASLGIGLDIQKAYAEFDSVATNLGADIPEMTDTTSTNKLNDTGYGYHLGGLYEFSEHTRVGVSYHSQVVHHLTGSSSFEGLIPGDLWDYPELRSGHTKTNLTLPPYTAMSIYHRLNDAWALMSSVLFTQWTTVRQLALTGVAGADTNIEANNNLEVIVPEHYRNTWNFSVGANYHATEKITLRGSVGYDQTPVRDGYRNVQLPDNHRYIVAFGGHFQATKHVGVDVGWTHSFVSQVNINPPPTVAGLQTTSTNGHVNGGADVLGGQIVWDMV